MDTASTLKSLPEEEVEALFACACFLQGNWPRSSRADVVFIPGLAADNWQATARDDGILATAARLWPAHAASIAIPGYGGTYVHGPFGPPSETGYPGYECWREALGELSVDESSIIAYASGKVGPDGKSWNTRSEVDAFLEVARERAWRHVVVVTTPFHTLRVLLTLVKALGDRGLTIRVDTVTPPTISWAKQVYHSQGIKRSPRYAHIAEEWKRIPIYQQDGSICSFTDLREYLLDQHALGNRLDSQGIKT